MSAAKGNADSTISITQEDADARAEALALAANSSSWYKQSKLRKAEFYKALAEGRLADGWLSYKYISPASNREITRYFDTMMSAENYGSPIVFGNMLTTDLTEFFSYKASGSEALWEEVREVGQ